MIYQKGAKELAHYTLDEVSLGLGTCLKHGYAIPITFDAKPASLPGAKSALHASQLPLAMYSVIYEMFFQKVCNLQVLHHLIIINAFCQGPEFWTSIAMWVVVQLQQFGVDYFGLESSPTKKCKTTFHATAFCNCPRQHVKTTISRNGQ
jgi:hypothetical protein